MEPNKSRHPPATKTDCTPEQATTTQPQKQDCLFNVGLGHSEHFAPRVDLGGWATLLLLFYLKLRDLLGGYESDRRNVGRRAAAMMFSSSPDIFWKEGRSDALAARQVCTTSRRLLDVLARISAHKRRVSQRRVGRKAHESSRLAEEM